jgi:hypothetical protein
MCSASLLTNSFSPSTIVHRGLLADHYGYNTDDDNLVPIIDSAYVLLDFESDDAFGRYAAQQSTLGCLELCMFAEGSRHQEEISVTGMLGRLEGETPLEILRSFYE